MEPTLTPLRALPAAQRPAYPVAAPSLQMISATPARTLCNSVRMVPIPEVLYFEAADPSIRVLTAKLAVSRLYSHLLRAM